MEFRSARAGESVCGLIPVATRIKGHGKSSRGFPHRRPQALRFSWDVFNATHAVRFDDGTLNRYLLYGTTLGNLSRTLTHPRVMQFGVRYSF
ncbi:MAG TPA: hypothetical protein VEN79_14925 [Terriglobia bacterium]|nr:hypothetical protein [Terriglobia bacterium]